MGRRTDAVHVHTDEAVEVVIDIRLFSMKVSKVL